jgi:hypothetical protein
LHIENGKGSGAYNRIANYYYYEIKKGMTDMIHITQHCSTQRNGEEWRTTFPFIYCNNKEMFFQQNNKEMLICQKKKEMLNGISRNRNKNGIII